MQKLLIHATKDLVNKLEEKLTIQLEKFSGQSKKRQFIVR
jgi:hypothetical protein